ncbi:hypothetical protein GY45DRAFT_1439224 [Cubamyces sp. BRFM 1775]|nr:hypothetical protein GY45DRAFT_1439224 [Cubamyces sp. BRFM 1775]
MSSSTAVLNPEIIQFVSATLLDNRLSIAAVTLLAYDYVITFGQEVQYIWMRKKTGAACLFFAVRYLALLALVFLESMSYIPMSDHITASAQIAQYVPWAVFSGLRALALSGLNWPLATIVFVVACGPFAVNVWTLAIVGVVGENYPVVGCIGSTALTAAQAPVSRPSVGLSRASAITADLLVIVITMWYAMKGGTRTLRHVRSSVPSFTRVLVVNGTIYFLALLTLNSLHLILTLVSIVEVVEAVSQVTIFTDPLTAILICRFLLALHSTNAKVVDETSASSQFDRGGDDDGTLQFASMIVGTMGGTVALESEDTLSDVQ